MRGLHLNEEAVGFTQEASPKIGAGPQSVKSDDVCLVLASNLLRSGNDSDSGELPADAIRKIHEDDDLRMLGTHGRRLGERSRCRPHERWIIGSVSRCTIVSRGRVFRLLRERPEVGAR